MTLQDPHGFLIGAEAGMAAVEHGFCLPQPPKGPLRTYRSTRVPGTVRLAAVDATGPWTLALEQASVAADDRRGPPPCSGGSTVGRPKCRPIP